MNATHLLSIYLEDFLICIQIRKHNKIPSNLPHFSQHYPNLLKLRLQLVSNLLISTTFYLQLESLVSTLEMVMLSIDGLQFALIFNICVNEWQKCCINEIIFIWELSHVKGVKQLRTLLVRKASTRDAQDESWSQSHLPSYTIFWDYCGP